MVRHRNNRWYFILVVLFLLSFSLMFGQFGAPVVAEVADSEVVAVETPIPTQPPPTQPPPTDTPTDTPTEQPTRAPETATVTPQPTPLPPAEIPEPITVILFGTGLAALSAAAARRKKAE